MQVLAEITHANRELWLAERVKGIGGSEMAAILGLSRWSDAAEVYMGKLGMMEAHDLSENEAVEWGTRLEDAVAQKFADEHPEFRVIPGGFWRHDTHTWLQSTPDRLLVRDGIVVAILEIKTAGWKQAPAWGDAGTDDVPRYYHVQCDSYMAGVDGHTLTGLPVRIEQAYICPLIGGQSYREYVIPRDFALETLLIERGSYFWHENVLKQEPPELGWMPSSKALVGRMFPKAGEEVRDAITQEEFSALSTYREWDLWLAAAKQGHAQAENTLKQLIGASAGIQHPSIGRATWKNTKESAAVDYEAVVQKLLAEQPGIRTAIEAAIAEHTTVRPGYRKIHKRWEE